MMLQEIYSSKFRASMGYQDKYGIDYQETFPRVDMNGTICLLLVVAANWRKSPMKGDVTDAFYQGIS
jgi:hypothetical protein